MKPAELDLELYQGSDHSLDLTLTLPGTPVAYMDLSGYVVTSQVRVLKKSPTVALEFTCTVDADPTTGKITISATAAETMKLAENKYFWDLRLTSPTTSFIILAGVIDVSGCVTR